MNLYIFDIAKKKNPCCKLDEYINRCDRKRLRTLSQDPEENMKDLPEYLDNYVKRAQIKDKAITEYNVRLCRK